MVLVTDLEEYTDTASNEIFVLYDLAAIDNFNAALPLELVVLAYVFPLILIFTFWLFITEPALSFKYT